MSTENKLADIASKTLGSSASYAVHTDKFDPSLINPMPRAEARESWGIDPKSFVGFDTWHCHEATFLTDTGIPIAGTLKMVYSANSEFMIESKSAKLYLNTFDMCKMGKTKKKAIANYEKQISSDISAALKTKVKVKFFGSGSHTSGEAAVDMSQNYVDLAHIIPDDTQITDYKAAQDHLTFVHAVDHGKYDSKVSVNCLRSRCRITFQKDSGVAYIHIVTKDSVVDSTSIFKQIVSLRDVNEFHEFCAEKLFASIMKHPEVVDCAVTLLYSRRGSWDINPTRASKKSLLPRVLGDVNTYTEKAMGQ